MGVLKKKTLGNNTYIRKQTLKIKTVTKDYKGHYTMIKRAIQQSI